MAATKISALTQLTSPDPLDLVAIVDDPSGTPITKNITLADLAKGFRVIQCSGQSLTGSEATSLASLAATWNTTGTPTAISLNITDTASNAASLLMDLLVGGSSRFKVAKTGDLTIAGQLRLANTTGCELVKQSATNYIESTTGFSMSAGAGSGCSMQNNGFTLGPSATIGFTNSNGVSAKDTILARDAANILAQRNGTNAQTKRLYGTYTDASNYRRVSLAMTTAGVATLLPEGAGTGASGNVLHISGLPTSNPGPGILWNNAGTPAIGT